MTAQSVSSETTTMLSTWTFASPWALSAHGREDLMGAFKKSEPDAEALFLPEDSSPEFISFKATEDDFMAFVSFATAWYDKELCPKIQQVDDPYEEPKLTRLAGTGATEAPLTKSLPVLSYDIPCPVEESEQLFDHENFSRKWAPPPRQDQSRFWAIVPATFIGRIEKLANVRLEHPLNALELTIFGDSEAAVDLAARKLANLEESMTFQISIHNYPVLEAQLTPQLCLISLRDVPDSRLRTTLLSPHLHKSLPKSRILVLTKDGEIPTLGPTAQIEGTTHLWDGHHLTILSSEGEPQPMTIKATPTSRWVDESNTSQVVDPFAPLAPQQGNDPVSTIAPKTTLPKPPPQDLISTKRVRKVKGAEEPPKVAESPSSYEHGAESSKPLDAEASSHPHSLERTESSPTIDNVAQNLAKLPTEPPSDIVPPAIQPPFMPPPSIEVPWIVARPYHNWEQSVAPSLRRGNTLIDVGPSGVDLHQGKPRDEKGHRTMGQKKGPLPRSQNQLVELHTEQVRGMLCSMSACFKVKLAMFIGRILIDRRSIADEGRKGQFGIKEWPRIVNHLSTTFTERLTTKSADASFIINLKGERGRRLFEETPSKHDVTFVIGCLTKSGEQIMIEIYEDKNFTVYGDKITHGTISWHFPRRAWDACLQVTAQDFTGGDLSKETETFVESLKIFQTEGTAGVSISASSKGSNFQVQSITLRRENVHNAIIPAGLQLHLTEVQALMVHQSASDAEIFIADIAPQDDMVAEQRLWWEVSISSKQANDILKESDTLELGEKAAWTTKSILELDVVEDLYELAQDVVTRIDSVGIGNKGPATAGSKETTKPSVRSHELPTGEHGFW